MSIEKGSGSGEEPEDGVVVLLAMDSFGSAAAATAAVVVSAGVSAGPVEPAGEAAMDDFADAEEAEGAESGSVLGVAFVVIVTGAIPSSDACMDMPIMSFSSGLL